MLSYPLSTIVAARVFGASRGKAKPLTAWVMSLDLGGFLNYFGKVTCAKKAEWADKRSERYNPGSVSLFVGSIP